VRPHDSIGDVLLNPAATVARRRDLQALAATIAVEVEAVAVTGLWLLSHFSRFALTAFFALSFHAPSGSMIGVSGALRGVMSAPAMNLTAVTTGAMIAGMTGVMIAGMTGAMTATEPALTNSDE